MSEYGGLAGIWEDINNNLAVDVVTYKDTSSMSDLPLVTKFTVMNKGSQHRLEIFFEEVVLSVGVPPDLHVERRTNLASGESFTYEHRSHYSDLGKIEFSIDGKVSPSHLLQVRNDVKNIPTREASLPLATYVEVLKDINLHRWLKDVITTLKMPGVDANSTEIAVLKDKLRCATEEIEETKKQMGNISRFIIRKTDKDRVKMNQHNKLVEDYLNDTSRACSSLRNMLDTYNTRTLESSRQDIVNQLSEKAAKLDQITESLI